MELNSNMLKCIHMMVYTDKQKQEIAAELGVANNCISRWLQREDFQEELKKETHRGFSSLALKARRRLEQLIDSNNDVVALGACKEVLNKAGFMGTQKVEQKLDTVINVNIE